MKPLLICGTAKCLWDDLRALGTWPHAVMAINRAAFDVPYKVMHWVSCHPDFFEHAVPFFKWLRRDVQDTVPVTHSTEQAENVNAHWDFRPHDYSGYFACKVALAMEYTSIVLAGIPMDNTMMHYYDDGKDAAGRVDSYPLNEVWDTLPPYCIRSMSGKTREKFGYPEKVGYRATDVSRPDEAFIRLVQSMTAPQAA